MSLNVSPPAHHTRFFTFHCKVQPNVLENAHHHSLGLNQQRNASWDAQYHFTQTITLDFALHVLLDV